MQQTTTLEQKSEIAGLFLALLPRELDEPPFCLGSFWPNNVALQHFPLVDPTTLRRKELRIAITDKEASRLPVPQGCFSGTLLRD